LLAASLYRITGSFPCAAQGLLALLAAVSFWTSGSLLKARGSWLFSAFCGRALRFVTDVSHPPLEKRGNYQRRPLLALPVVGHQGRRRKTWGKFCLWWVVAIAARQSALTWAVFPAIELIRLTRKSSREARSLWTLGLTLLIGLGLFGTLNWMRNKTHAQSVVTDHLLERLPGLEALRVAGLGLLVYLWAAGLSGFLSSHRHQVGGSRLG